MGGKNSTAEEPRAELPKRDHEPLPDKLHVLKFICDNGGVVSLSTLCHQHFFVKQLTAKSFLERHPQFFCLEHVTEDNCEVRAHTRAGVCDEYGARKDDCSLSDCSKFHLCKHLVTGSCKFGTRCKSSHELHSYHNEEVLKINQLLGLDDDFVLQLLKLSCVEYTVPDVCSFYNSPRGCRNADSCTFMHICSHYIKGDCKFSNGCRLSHTVLDQQPRKVLMKFGIDVNKTPEDLIQMIRYKKKREHNERGDPGDQKNTTSLAGTNSVVHLESSASSAISMVPDAFICVFHLGGLCNYGNKCINLHAEEPFQWQYKIGQEWRNFDKDHNLEIEKAFCNCNCSFSWSDRFNNKPCTGVIEFSENEQFSMKYNPSANIDKRDVRRIAPSFETQGWKKVVSTNWRWYWKDDNGQYVEYGNQSIKGTQATINSTTLEEAYRRCLSGEQGDQIQFKTGKHQYLIRFTSMEQRNLTVGTTRKVGRRPEFVRKADINDRIKRNKDLQANMATPDKWNLVAPTQTNEGFDICPMTRGSNEYSDVDSRFRATMSGAAIVSIERVQNKELWDDFCRKRIKMEKKNVGKVKEELLFHGTVKEVLYAICQQNFDHRLSGTRVGAKHGQGSYFHKDARFSNSYAKAESSTGQKRMFLARVLVGSYTRGNSAYRRPPSKDPRKPLENFYDSCVDDLNNPRLFVVFENNQVYPEYIITYH